jgi:predicted RNase H-like HicB family nuclease
LGGAAESREEMEQLMSEAIPFHLEGLRDDREEQPWPYTPERLSPELRAVFERIDAA